MSYFASLSFQLIRLTSFAHPDPSTRLRAGADLDSTLIFLMISYLPTGCSAKVLRSDKEAGSPRPPKTQFLLSSGLLATFNLDGNLVYY